MSDAWSDALKGESFYANNKVERVQRSNFDSQHLSDSSRVERVHKKVVINTLIGKGDMILLKSKYHKYYVDKFNPKTVDITKPAKVKKVSSYGKIYIEGWEEIHNKKMGKGFPNTSFDKLSERQIRIFGFYKPEPIVVKSIGQIQDCDDKSFTLCIFSNDNIINIYPNELLIDVAPIEKGVYITVISTITKGKQIIEFLQSTEDEIKQHNS